MVEIVVTVVEKDAMPAPTLPEIPDPVDVTFPYAHRLQILFDGKIITYCTEASVKGCYVIMWETDDNGDLRLDQKTGQFVVIRRRGVVEVRYKED